MFFIYEEAKETTLDFSQGTIKVLQMVVRYYNLDIISNQNIISI